MLLLNQKSAKQEKDNAAQLQAFEAKAANVAKATAAATKAEHDAEIKQMKLDMETRAEAAANQINQLQQTITDDKAAQVRAHTATAAGVQLEVLKDTTKLKEYQDLLDAQIAEAKAAVREGTLEIAASDMRSQAAIKDLQVANVKLTEQMTQLTASVADVKADLNTKFNALMDSIAELRKNTSCSVGSVIEQIGTVRADATTATAVATAAAEVAIAANAGATSAVAAADEANQLADKRQRSLMRTTTDPPDPPPRRQAVAVPGLEQAVIQPMETGNADVPK